MSLSNWPKQQTHRSTGRVIQSTVFRAFPVEIEVKLSRNEAGVARGMALQLILFLGGSPKLLFFLAVFNNTRTHPINSVDESFFFERGRCHTLGDKPTHTHTHTRVISLKTVKTPINFWQHSRARTLELTFQQWLHKDEDSFRVGHLEISDNNTGYLDSILGLYLENNFVVEEFGNTSTRSFIGSFYGISSFIHTLLEPQLISIAGWSMRH